MYRFVHGVEWNGLKTVKVKLRVMIAAVNQNQNIDYRCQWKALTREPENRRTDDRRKDFKAPGHEVLRRNTRPNEHNCENTYPD